MSVNGDGSLEVELPAGGKLHLQNLDEVEMFEKSRERYIKDYQLSNQNDLALIGAILSQQLALYRAQQRMNAMEPLLDGRGVPTGEWKVNEAIKPQAQEAAQRVVIKAAGEIREMEKALGIDKKTRESSGAQDVQHYVGTLKRAGREYAIHITKRVKRMEEFTKGLSWRIRLLRNGDAEDRQYHSVTPKTVIEWCEQELAEIEEIDKTFAKEKGRLFVGKL